jgi:hypothetical protein
MEPRSAVRRCSPNRVGSISLPAMSIDNSRGKSGAFSQNDGGMHSSGAVSFVRSRSQNFLLSEGKEFFGQWRESPFPLSGRMLTTRRAAPVSLQIPQPDARSGVQAGALSSERIAPEATLAWDLLRRTSENDLSVRRCFARFVEEAVMETIFAFCITGLFSVWVWSLKSEVAGLHKQSPPSSHNRSQEPSYSRIRRLRDGDGSMIWTIE